MTTFLARSKKGKNNYRCTLSELPGCVVQKDQSPTSTLVTWSKWEVVPRLLTNLQILPAKLPCTHNLVLYKVYNVQLKKNKLKEH